MALFAQKKNVQSATGPQAQTPFWPVLGPRPVLHHRGCTLYVSLVNTGTNFTRKDKDTTDPPTTPEKHPGKFSQTPPSRCGGLRGGGVRANTPVLGTNCYDWLFFPQNKTKCTNAQRGLGPRRRFGLPRPVSPLTPRRCFGLIGGPRPVSPLKPRRHFGLFWGLVPYPPKPRRRFGLFWGLAPCPPLVRLLLRASDFQLILYDCNLYLCHV